MIIKPTMAKFDREEMEKRPRSETKFRYMKKPIRVFENCKEFFTVVVGNWILVAVFHLCFSVKNEDRKFRSPTQGIELVSRKVG